MKIYKSGLIVGIFLSMAQVAVAMPQTQAKRSDLAENTNAIEPGPASAREFLKEVEEVTALAMQGSYGSISAKDVKRLLDARATIHRLLDGVEYAVDLRTELHMELFNAQEEFAAVIRDNELDRRICKRVSVKGTRIPAYDCSTVAQYKERARVSSEMTRILQRVR